MQNRFLTLSNKDQQLLITNTSRELKLQPAIIEKDFWVCFLLEYLFTTFKYKDFICFKGGTSLSKVYHCIERFSEDIDLALDWSVLGLLKEDAYTNRSNRQQDFFNKSANKKTEEYLEKIWLPLIQDDLSKVLNTDFKLYIDIENPHTICFQYPRVYQDASILQIIRLEIGVLVEPVPSHPKKVNSYLAQYYPNVLGDNDIVVKTVSIYRTFFEKITILHREVNRINGNYPARYSRHFYDLYQMIVKGIGEESLKEMYLLKMVVDFKKKFYPCNWANYDEVMDGNCKLIPNNHALEIFSKDYDQMKHMFYGDYPTFEEIIDQLLRFQNTLNQAIKKYTYIAID